MGGMVAADQPQWVVCDVARIGEPLESEAYTPEEDRMEDAIQDLQAQIDGGVGVVRVSVYRLTDKGDRIYLTTVSADAFALDALRDTYGGGDYGISMSVKGVKGIPPRNWKVRIEAPPGWTPASSVPPPAPVASVPDVPATPPAPARDMILEQMAADRARSDRMIEALLGSLRPPDPAAQLSSMLQLWQGFQSMIPAAAPVVQPSSLDGLELTERVLEMARTLSPRGETSSADVLLETVKGIVPVLREALVDQRAAPAAAPVPAADPEQEEDEPRGSEMVAERMFMAQLIAGAESGQQPAQWIAPVLRVVPADKARQFLAGPDALETLASIDERVMQHEEWFRKLGTLVVAQLDQNAVEGANDDAVLSA